MTELIISIISIVISCIAVGILFLKLRIDRPIIEFQYDIMCNDDRSKEWIRIYVFNTGRRPVFIKSIGIFDWTLGHFISGENKSVDKLLDEAEMLFVDEPIKSTQQWRVGKLFALDHTGRRWVTSKKQMQFIFESSHYDGRDEAKISKMKKEWDKKKKRAQKEYYKTIKKLNKKPKPPSMFS